MEERANRGVLSCLLGDNNGCSDTSFLFFILILIIVCLNCGRTCPGRNTL